MEISIIATTSLHGVTYNELWKLLKIIYLHMWSDLSTLLTQSAGLTSVAQQSLCYCRRTHMQ